MYCVKISLIFLCILHDELFISFYSIFSVFLGLQVYVAKNFSFYYLTGSPIYFIHFYRKKTY